MSRPGAGADDLIVARVVHKSVVVDQPGGRPVIKLMLNLMPHGRKFEPGADIGFLVPGAAPDDGQQVLRRYTLEAVGEVPFENSVDITIYVRDHGTASVTGISQYLAGLALGDTLPLAGPFNYPFHPPMGSRSNMILIGAGCGMVPFRWLAHKVQARKLDWMGKVLMLEGPETGLEHLYMNEPGINQDQYFDSATQRAFEALKTRYSATALDRSESTAANMDALWRLMGQGRVYVYLAGYRAVAAAMDEAMARHLRLPGRWDEAKAALVSGGHWVEFLYD